jgi:rod shape determining protein RodA
MTSIYKKFDIILLVSFLGLLALGLVGLYSSSNTAMEQGVATNYFVKQLIWVIVGIFFLIGLYFIPLKWIIDSAYTLYGLNILLLVIVIFFGKSGQGAVRWLQIGPIFVQPSEFAKLATILAVSRFISKENVDINTLKDFLVTALFFVIPFILIIRQPDLGTSMVFVAIALPMMNWAGLKFGNLVLILMPFLMVFASFQFYTFLILMAVLVFYLLYSKRSKFVVMFNFLVNIFMGLITPVLWNNLKPYQRNRIMIFVNPEADPQGAGYQIIQSKVAVGSGGVFGKGFMEGSQTQLRFLPEQHTDFIFAVIGEEFGFTGVLLGLLLYVTLFIRGIQIASLVKNRFSSITSIGIVTVLAFHVVINISMTVGLLPVTGLPLPFISYGGSSLLTNFIMIGILLNFYKNRYEY